MSVTSDQVRVLYESTLKPRIEGLEGFRREVRGYVLKSALLIGVPLLMFAVAAGVLPGSMGSIVSFASFGLIVIGILIAGFQYVLPGFTAFANYRARFKREVVSEVFRIVAPAAEYDAFKGIAKEVFDEPGLFNTRGGYDSDDRIRGYIGQTPFEAADVSRTYTSGSRNKQTRHVVFRGLFFHLDFNRSLRGTTIVEPRAAWHSQIGDREGLQAIALGDQAFDKAFLVYATEAAEARDLLTPVMRSQILALAGEVERPTFLAFKGTRAYIGIHYNRRLFEPGIAATTSLEAVQEIASHFALAETIVHQLDLDNRTADGDDSMFDRPEEASTPFEAAVASGDLTVGQVWDMAAARVGVDNPDDETNLPRPAGTSIDVQHLADAARVSYGISFGFVLSVAISLAGLVVAAAALRALGQNMNLGSLATLAARVPPISQLDEVVATYPPGWLGGSLLVSAIFTFGWMTRVRRVVIRPDAVLVSRGLRPFPRRYARPPFGRVVRIDKVIYVGKVGSTSLMNPSASPVLDSEEEARWLAAEMRRALQQTSRQ